MKLKSKLVFLGLLLFFSSLVFSQNRLEIGEKSTSEDSPVSLKLVARTQNFKSKSLVEHDHFDTSINSPKSILFSVDGSKYYVNSLEGFTTCVFETVTHKKIKDIRHVFHSKNQHLFLKGENTAFDYAQLETKTNPNVFSGKPVESCLSHKGKYLWVSYYRRDWDKNAQYPSAVAVIDTEKDEIIRVIPTGPLPKMVACSPDNKYIAVTHWGDNTVGIIDISSDSPQDFQYQKHLIVGEKAKLNYTNDSIIDRDNNCGHCLRGTVFTEDSKYLFVGRMGGEGGISVFQTSDFKSLGTVSGMKSNVRHLDIIGDNLYLSSNKHGYVQRCSVSGMLQHLKKSTKSWVPYNNWKSCFVGLGARTISLTKDGKYIFVAVNNECKIAVVRSSDMKVINTIAADPFPVGMALSKFETRLIVTAQGKGDVGGNSVTIYSVEYK